jgi:steroid delta-isomerase
MTRDQALDLARHWIDAWNARDVETVLGHFDDSVRFTSPKAATITGNALVVGKDALRAYWTAALSRITSIRFTLDRALWDDDRATLTIVYQAELNGQKNRACEFLRFGEGGAAVEGEAMYGA